MAQLNDHSLKYSAVAVASSGDALAYAPAPGTATNPLKAMPAQRHPADGRVVAVWAQGLVDSRHFADDASDNSIKANLRWRFRAATRHLLVPAVLTAVLDSGEHAHDAAR
ncbi:hypothetical protein [Ancylobacter pratisalsi]|uniref:Uncharacterized protein n=1 Tax=Ancylobacter pratisalsi TaxID=1745854 RepID=A0A6P1YIG0_9HYPH|nr:hypothetical protein [Ancylobacter pratisalsi]QIB33128.1 hypothetical protein G3A50_04965 [Ancylobacter pratisalsi]